MFCSGETAEDEEDDDEDDEDEEDEDEEDELGFGDWDADEYHQYGYRLPNEEALSEEEEPARHMPVRIVNVNGCEHEFGLACLKKWVKGNTFNSNRCPKCRVKLFEKQEMSYPMAEHVAHFAEESSIAR